MIKGQKHSKETRIKMSIAAKNRDNSRLKDIGFKKGNKINFGRKRPDLTERNIKNNPMWSKTKRKNTEPLTTISWNGYILRYVPDHPYCDSHGYVREHRLIMEKHIGRYLSPSEVVHHINRDRKDNRIENLVLFETQIAHRRYHANEQHHI